jgi:hypothetical protein
MVIAPQAPQIFRPPIPFCSRFDSVLFTPKMPAIAGRFNFSRSPQDKAPYAQRDQLVQSGWWHHLAHPQHAQIKQTDSAQQQRPPKIMQRLENGPQPATILGDEMVQLGSSHPKLPWLRQLGFSEQSDASQKPAGNPTRNLGVRDEASRRDHAHNNPRKCRNTTRTIVQSGGNHTGQE